MTQKIELHDALTRFRSSAHSYYKSYAYEAGYLESTLIHLFPKLSKKLQKELIESVLRATQKIDGIAPTDGEKQ